MRTNWDMVLSGYDKFPFSWEKWKRPVYNRGSGPAVIVIHEIPGLHPQVIRFSDRIVDAGMTVFLPVLFGDTGRPATTGYVLRETFKMICIRREFNCWSAGKSSPIVDWLRALAREAHTRCGGPGVGAVGMCVTGGFALAMMTEPAVVAPVLSQPSLPIAICSRKRGARLDASPEEITCAKKRFANENLSIIGLRFKSDPFVPDSRFAAYQSEFEDKFEAIELEDKDALPGTRRPHSVLTLHMSEHGPTKAAEQRVIRFLKERTGTA